MLGRWRQTSRNPGRYRVVVHRPWWRALMASLVALTVLAAFGFGYWLGTRKVDLDADLVTSLVIGEQARDAHIGQLTRDLADAELAQSVDAQAAQSLRQTISDQRDEMATLREEVTFYKSLMAPSSLERGLQIAEFELGAGEAEHQFTYHLLLTQTAERRSYIEGGVTLDVYGVRSGADDDAPEEVLSLTELSDVAKYPVRYRFRYFQDINGVVTLPEGFRPRAVVVRATPKGAAADALEQRFDWRVRSG